jgi:hypothetical protein
MRRDVATEEVLNIETNFLALEITVAKLAACWSIQFGVVYRC